MRGKVAEVSDAARLPGEEGKLIIQTEDTLAGKQRRIPVDMVILSSGLEPRHDAKEVAKLFGLSCSADGWLIEKHPKLDPVATMTEGIFIAGCNQGPKDIPSSVAQGAAAAAVYWEGFNKEKSSLNLFEPASPKMPALAAGFAMIYALIMQSFSTKTGWCLKSTRRCARGVAPVSQHVQQAQSPARCSAMSRYLPRLKDC